MIRGKFLTEQQRVELKQIVRRALEMHGVARRANAILLLDDGWNCQQVAEAFYLDDDTIREWHKRFMSGGFDELETFDWKGGQPYLSVSQEEELEAFLDKNLYRNTNEIRAHIAREYGQDFSRSGCIKLMHRLGFSYKKPSRLPAQADEEKQRQFIADYERLQRHLPDDEAVYFVDAVHPEHQSRPAFGWIKKGTKIAVKSNSGRKRMNLHGALCLENFDCPLVEVEKVNADSTIALFKKLEAANPDKKMIHVILDNARYHHAIKVQEWLARPDCRIKPIWLPTYAPHLNAIERLWGVMHENVTHNQFYPTFRDFAAAIHTFFAKTVPKNWKDFRDKITDNFRIISYLNFRVLE